MHPRIANASLLAAFLTATVLGAQSPAAPSFPNTPAGTVVKAWYDAFGSGDTLRILDFYRRYQPERIEQNTVQFRTQAGGFDILSIERAEPRRIEFVARERRTPQTYYAAVDLSPADPPRIASSFLIPLGPNATLETARIDAAGRANVIERAIAKLDSFYVFPDVAKRMADSLRARQARGDYDAYANAVSFALKLNRDVGELSRDKHMRVNYSANPIPPRPATPRPPTREDSARMRAQMDEFNCGFVKVEQLDGNVGYVKFNGFFDVGACGPTASAAMNFVAGSRALIVDLRDNGGGSPAMVAYISSYLFSTRTHLNDLWTRHTGKTEEFWTRDDVPGRRFGGEKPVYVLTSSRTFSGAEEFSYNLKSLKRATIIGETTGGGAHPVMGHRIDEHFMIGVPFARAVNPITRTNWEGTGVEPDVKVPATEALATALRLIREGVRQ
ncbi:MAG TPA: S41 family peptidase [Gemmatimonadaceae bacterium]|nr:S41 family peptidase [Gemmatimonadaceae bacterium]